MAYNPMPQGGYFAMQRQPMPAQYQQTFQPQQQVNPNQYWAQQMPPSTNQMRNYPTQYLTMAGQMRPQNPYQMQPQMQPQIGPQYRPPQQGYQGVGNPAQFQPVSQSQVITPTMASQPQMQAQPSSDPYMDKVKALTPEQMSGARQMWGSGTDPNSMAWRDAFKRYDAMQPAQPQQAAPQPAAVNDSGNVAAPYGYDNSGKPITAETISSRDAMYSTPGWSNAQLDQLTAQFKANPNDPSLKLFMSANKGLFDKQAARRAAGITSG